MKLRFDFPSPIDPERLAADKITFAGRVPQAYWELIEEVGCGELETILWCKAPDNHKIIGAFGTLLGPCTDPDYTLKLPDYMPACLQEIMSSVGYGGLYVDCRPETNGHIYIYDNARPADKTLALPLEVFEGDQDMAEMFFFLAPSFEAFLAMCTPMTEDEAFYEEERRLGRI
jgi:hypothetical protein